MSSEKPGLLIALSAGGTNDELSVLGLGTAHINELMVRLSMRLLGDGHRLAFGGTLGDTEKPLTKHLIDTAQLYLSENSAKALDVTEPTTWPLLNYAAWPNYDKVSEEQRARLVGVCQFVDVDPDGLSKQRLKSASDLEKVKLTADALSAMRDLSARDCDLRVVWGGKIKGSSGWMPGILEEVACSLRYRKPVLILGGFGGCARVLAEFLAEEDARWPFAEAWQVAAAIPELADAAPRLDEAKQLMLEFRRARFSSAAEVLGVPRALIDNALTEENARAAIGLVATAAKELAIPGR